MKPYYEHDGVTIYHGDCLDVLPRLSCSPVDVVATDPPYGIGYVSNMRAVNLFGELVGDREFSAEWLTVIRRVLRRDRRVPLYCFANDRSLAATQQAIQGAGFGLNTLLVWDKQALAAGDLDDYAKRTEFIVFATTNKGPLRLNGSRDGNLLSIPRVDTRKLVHPTEKPADLLKYLLIRSSDPGDLVIDPFMGSGTTLRAAKDLGRRAIGIEIEERYCEVAANRLAQEVLDFGSGEPGKEKP